MDERRPERNNKGQLEARRAQSPRDGASEGNRQDPSTSRVDCGIRESVVEWDRDTDGGTLEERIALAEEPGEGSDYFFFTLRENDWDKSA